MDGTTVNLERNPRTMIFDAHLDLSFNALSYNRDLACTTDEIRRVEHGMQDLAGRGRSTVSFPEMRRAGIGLCVATQLAGCMKPAGPSGGWNAPEIAWSMTQGQLAWYRAMEQAGHLRQITSPATLEYHLAEWKLDPIHAPIGYILSLEGADSLRSLADLETAFEYGLRAIGPAHYGIGRYAAGHDHHLPLSPAGSELLVEMNRLGMILDVTHLSEPTFWSALEVFDGPVWASHHNCRALVDDPRQLSDDQIRKLAERDAVIGAALDVWMVVPGWERGTTTHAAYPNANLQRLADHIDHICQLLGTSKHSGLGTDLDGGFGTEQTPSDVDTIADLSKLISILERRGYSPSDLHGICSANFLRVLRRAWT